MSDGGLSFDVGRSRWRKSLAALDRLGVWGALALLIVVASTLSPYFFSLNNFLNILNQSSVVGVAAVGVTLVMITGGPRFPLAKARAMTVSAWSPFVLIGDSPAIMSGCT
jgi:ribose transport system permease protein